MTKIEKVLYTAKTHSSGGREGGSSRTDDGRLDVKFTLPGTPGTGTNPEQLFAAGWSTCFIGTIKRVAGKKKIALTNLAPASCNDFSFPLFRVVGIGMAPTAFANWIAASPTLLAAAVINT